MPRKPRAKKLTLTFLFFSALRSTVQKSEVTTPFGIIGYSLCRSSKRRTLAIAVDHHAQVRVFAPTCVHEKRVTQFIHEKSRWIIEKVREFEQRLPLLAKHHYIDGEEFLFLGKKYFLRYVPSEKKRVKIEVSDCLEAFVSVEVPWDRVEGCVKRAIFSWYRQQAKRIVNERLPLWTEKLGMSPHKIAIRTQKRIWGSCYYRTRTININWKIVMAPLEVIDYIILHELCHLHAPNHSKRFWSKVRSLLPHFKDCEKWLKENEPRMSLS